MTYVALMLLIALAGTAEDAPTQPEGVITETCNNENANTNECVNVTSTTTPSELPGPPPNGQGGHHRNRPEPPHTAGVPFYAAG